MHWLYNGFVQAIPESTRSFFQEYDFGLINIEHDSDLVIERLLAYGNREEVGWLLGQYGHSRVRGWLTESGKRLPRRRYRLWCVLLDVRETPREREPLWLY